MATFKRQVQQFGMNMAWRQGPGEEHYSNLKLLERVDERAGRGNKVEQSRHGIAEFFGPFGDPVVVDYRPGGVDNSQPGPPNRALPEFKAWKTKEWDEFNKPWLSYGSTGDKHWRRIEQMGATLLIGLLKIFRQPLAVFVFLGAQQVSSTLQRPPGYSSSASDQMDFYGGADKSPSTECSGSKCRRTHQIQSGQISPLQGLAITNKKQFVEQLEKSAQKAFAVLRMIRRTFSRITRTDFQILYGAYVRPLLEYANPVVYSGRTKDVILIERVQRAATKMVAGLKSMDYETRLAVLDLFPLEYRRLRGDLILTYALFEQGLANGFFTLTQQTHGGDTRTYYEDTGASLILVNAFVSHRQNVCTV
ncbi:hypothetical protein CLF_101189 [Clonorchis sinensis]|uniref:Pol-related protein n=1 Tax=Clonorchis sinensis TaxID=79923 RepID=G7Y574_CLOSI|nr:hypothetical protein CLF_101189 [Clonorchis sinensis]